MEPLQQPPQKNRSRNLAFIGIFGGIWGITEITAGSYIHAFNIPFGGAFMSAMAILIFLPGTLFIDDKFAIIKIGAVACFIKIFSIGSIILPPLISIAVEAIVSNIIILLFSKNIFSFTLTGAVIVTYTFFHKFIAQGILFGRGILIMYIEVLNAGSKMLGINIQHAFVIIFLLIILHIILGIIAGITAFSLANQAKKRLGYK